MFPHLSLPFGRKPLSFPYRLHYFKRMCVFNTVPNKVIHNVITASDNMGDITNIVVNQFLSVARPNVGSVRQSRYLKKIRKGFRFSLFNHLHNKFCTEFRKTECTEIRLNVSVSDTKRLC